MTDPLDQGFELNGVLFGESGPLIVESFEPGSTDWRTQDAEMAMGDARYFGRDFKSPSTWSWTLGTNGRSEDDALTTLAALQKAWEPENRTTPGALSTLRYRVNGRIRRVYGRPRRFAYTPDVRRLQGYIPISTDFVRADSLHYDDEEQSVVVTAAASVTSTSTGGLLSPLVSPLVSVADKTATQRDGMVTVGGDTPTPIVIELHGQATNPWVKVEGLWTVSLQTSIAAGDTITLDGKPWVLSATRGSGGGVAGTIRGSRLSQLVLPPGQHAISFGAQSSTTGASATVRWRAASKTL